MEQNGKLSAKKWNFLKMSLYRCIVGNLIYMTIARPDLSYVVGLVIQFMQASRKPHLNVARHILRYVKSTLKYGVFYHVRCLIQILRYTNVDWVGGIFDSKSTSSFMFFLESATINWSSKK